MIVCLLSYFWMAIMYNALLLNLCKAAFAALADFTAETLEVNPAHGVALTYWQNLLKARVHETDHNGYMLGASYLAAALVVAACRRSAVLRGWTSVLAILSILLMSFLLMALTITSSQIIFYVLLVCIQCVYEVSASVSTFQVGSAVCKAVESEGGPQQPRLALLFCLTGCLSGAVAALVQHVKPISKRFMVVAVARPEMLGSHEKIWTKSCLRNLRFTLKLLEKETFPRLHCFC